MEYRILTLWVSRHPWQLQSSVCRQKMADQEGWRESWANSQETCLPSPISFVWSEESCPTHSKPLLEDYWQWRWKNCWWSALLGLCLPLSTRRGWCCDGVQRGAGWPLGEIDRVGIKLSLSFPYYRTGILSALSAHGVLRRIFY